MYLSEDSKFVEQGQAILIGDGDYSSREIIKVLRANQPINMVEMYGQYLRELANTRLVILQKQIANSYPGGPREPMFQQARLAENEGIEFWTWLVNKGMAEPMDVGANFNIEANGAWKLPEQHSWDRLAYETRAACPSCLSEQVADVWWATSPYTSERNEMLVCRACKFGWYRPAKTVSIGGSTVFVPQLSEVATSNLYKEDAFYIWESWQKEHAETTAGRSDLKEFWAAFNIWKLDYEDKDFAAYLAREAAK